MRFEVKKCSRGAKSAWLFQKSGVYCCYQKGGSPFAKWKQWIFNLIGVKTLTDANKIFDLLNGELTFNFAGAGIEKTIKIADIPEESLAVLLSYGCRKLNDRVNSQAKDSDTPKAELIDRALEDLLSGKLGSGRAPQSSNKAFKDFIFEVLKGQGYRVKDFEPVRGATPEVIVRTFWHNASPEQQATILEKLQQRFEQVKALASLDI